MDSSTESDKQSANCSNEDEEMNENLCRMQDTIFSDIIKQKNAFFHHLQQSDPDLTCDQKWSLLDSLFTSNKSSFLQRYGQFLNHDQLNFMASQNPDEEVSIQINVLKTSLNTKNPSILVKNRRFAAVQRMLASGSYFSQTEMQTRQPQLFQEMVKKFMDKDEKKAFEAENYRINHNDQQGKFSSYLLEQIRKNRLDCKELEEEEENDSSDDEQEHKNESQVDTVEKELLKKEFQDHMICRFLHGEDEEFFDYTTVDGNDEEDAERERDLQEEYFDHD